MNNSVIKSIVLMVLMVAASVAALALRPTQRMADQNHKTDFATVLPQRFGDWTAAVEVPALVVNPQEQELLDSLYTEIVSRTYVHKDGRQIMLSLAYGADQSHGSQIHKPEVCYPSQGYLISGLRKENLTAVGMDIPVMRLVAQRGPRIEPVTYWIRVGDRVVRGAVEQNLARIGYGLKGYIPDGLLFRVSEISPDAQQSFALQDVFVRDLLQALSADARVAIVGAPR